MWHWLKSWTVDGLIIVSTIIATLGEISLNFITSYGHISILGGRYGEKGIDGDLTPIIIDFALFAFAMLNLFLARKGRYTEVKKRNGRVKRKPEFRWPRWVLGGGVAATVAANIAYGMWWGYTGAAIAAFAAVMLFFTIEGAMLLLRVAAEDRERKQAAKPVAAVSAPAMAIPDYSEANRIAARNAAAVAEAKATVGQWEITEPAPVPEPSEGAEDAPEPEGKAETPALNLTRWQELNGTRR